MAPPKWPGAHAARPHPRPGEGGRGFEAAAAGGAELGAAVFCSGKTEKVAQNWGGGGVVGNQRCMLPRDVRTSTFCQLMNGYSVLLAGEQKATEFWGGCWVWKCVVSK